MNYDWITSPAERGSDEAQASTLIDETCQKVFGIYINRSSQLFSEDDTLMWLRETIGYALSEIDEGELDSTRDLLRAQLMSGIVDVSFTWSRYRTTLKTADFMDDLSIVNAQDLMFGGQQHAEGGNDFEDGIIEENPAQAEQNAQMEAQINNMID